MNLVNRIRRALKRTFLFRLAEPVLVRRRQSTWTADDQRMLTFYGQFIAPGDLCFDIGANIGNRSKVFLKLGASVVAVEPQVRCARILRHCFSNSPGFTLETVALGEKAGEAEMLISDSSVLSTLSPEWIERTTRSGRFADQRWDGRQHVNVVTIDDLIARHGVPVFVKIDVEGYEAVVLRGLSSPVPCLSIEFASEAVELTLECLALRQALGPVDVNYSLGESMSMRHERWRTVAEIADELRSLPQGSWGDVYVRATA
jgi:FkbM family methyltransferase